MKVPAWTREELILALDLYYKLDIAWLRKLTGNSNEMIELSRVLRNLSIHNIENRKSDSFRSSSSVHMKLMNFLRCDPRYGKAGLSNGSKLEREIWDEFKDNKEKLKKEAEAIIQKFKLQEIIIEGNELDNNANDYITEEYILIGNLHVYIDKAINDISNLQKCYSAKRKDAAFIESLEESQKVINDMYQRIVKVNNWKEKLLEIKGEIQTPEADNNKHEKVAEKGILSIEPDIKIGKLVKETLSSFINAQKFTDSDITDMLDEDWTRSTFHISHPFLKIVDETLPVAEQRKVDGYYRYWRDVFIYNDKKYLACKEWFEPNRKYFVKWAEKFCKDIDISAKTSSEYEAQRDKSVIKFSSKYSGITLNRSLLVFILKTIKEIDAEEVCIETNNLLKRVSLRIQEESSYKYPQHCVNNIIKFLTDAEILVLYQDAKKGKFIIEDYEIMQKLIENPELILEFMS